MLTLTDNRLLPADNRRARGERVDEAARFRALLAFDVRESVASAMTVGLCYMRIETKTRPEPRP